MQTRRLVLCADDYGISPGVSQGIRELAMAGRLSTTSVMSAMPSWPGEAAALKALDDKIDIGLHFTLTDQRPLGPMPTIAPEGRFPTIDSLAKRALLGRVPAAEIEAELDRQLDCFEAHFGRVPDYIDGHQHVHILPTVRGVVRAAFGRRLDPARTWLRSVSDDAWRIFSRPYNTKAGAVAAMASGCDAAARQRGIKLNRGFSGFYDPAKHTLAGLFEWMLNGAKDRHLMMVHPGYVDATLTACDSLTEPRAEELAWLASDEFPRRLAAAGFTLAGAGTLAS